MLQPATTGGGTRLPFVFVLDWDGTIAGRVDFQSHLHTLHLLMKRHNIKPAKAWGGATVPKAFHPGSKLIRPGFGSFLKQIKEHYQQVHFFVYTASEKSWANTEIAWFEKAYGVRFDRPIFTREDCTVDGGGNYRKSLSRVFPRILRSLSKGRVQPFTAAEKSHILEHQTMIIDNNAVYTDRHDKVLLCPDYNYVYFEHILDHIPEGAKAHPSVAQHILSMVNAGVMCPVPGAEEDHMAAYARQYDWLATKCKAFVMGNRVFEGDAFWKRLRKILVQNDIRSFRANTIQQIQKALWRKHQQRERPITAPPPVVVQRPRLLQPQRRHSLQTAGASGMQ